MARLFWNFLANYLAKQNRHFAEWRFWRLMLMLTVNPNTWKVSVIGIVPPPFGDVATTARRERDALSGLSPLETSYQF